MGTTERLGLLCSGGGIAGSYIAGVFSELYDAGVTADSFARINATSVSALIAPSYALGDIHKQLDIWLKGRLKHLMNWRRPHRPLDLEGLMEDAKSICPLNIHTLRRLRIPLEVSVTCCDTGESILIDLRTVPDPHDAMIASAALPQFHNAVPLLINGVRRRTVDGGMSRELPINRMMKSVNKVLVILCYPKEERASPMALHWRMLACPYPWRDKGLRSALLERHRTYNESLDRILQLEQEGRAVVIAPKQSLFDARGRSCCRWRLDTNQEGVNRAIELGRQDAQRAITLLSLAA